MQTLAPSASASRPSRWRRLGRALVVVVGIEVGLLLLTLPWMPLWDHAIWVTAWRLSHPAWCQAVLSPYVRGAVSGLGVINLWGATSEITSFRL